jgi:type IV secretory pathway VirB4 component
MSTYIPNPQAQQSIDALIFDINELYQTAHIVFNAFAGLNDVMGLMQSIYQITSTMSSNFNSYIRTYNTALVDKIYNDINTLANLLLSLQSQLSALTATQTVTDFNTVIQNASDQINDLFNYLI